MLALRLVSIFLTLFAFWLLLSGHYTIWLVANGALAALLVTLLGLRVGYADEEGHPVEMIVRGLTYWPWLLVEMAKSASTVARIVVSPRPSSISPVLFEVPTTQKTAIGTITYANSITLTPGTMTVAVDRSNRSFVVHALTRAGADDVRAGGMDRRVTRFEGKR